MITEYHTLAAEHRHEIPKIKGSRFIATVAPAATDDEARDIIARIGREFHDARHTCSAYRLGAERPTFRYDDDGEPSGSAGRPILQQIEGRDLVDVVVAVTRYFGGTKLGVGGLVRAYGDAAAAALDGAELRRIRRVHRIVVTHHYDVSSAIAAVLARTGQEPVLSEYEEEVTLAFDVPLGDAEAFTRAVRDACAGRVSIEDLGVRGSG